MINSSINTATSQIKNNATTIKKAENKLEEAIKKELSKVLGVDDKKYAKIAEACYDFTNKTAVIDDIVRNDKYTTSKKNGFQGCVYEDGDTIIVAYRGTDEGNKFFIPTKDWVSNYQMVNNKIPDQYADALVLYKKVANDPKYIDKNFIVTGHSLGGSLAELVSSTKFKNIKQPRAITFNAYGTDTIIKNYKNLFKTNKNNDNYYTSNDFFVGASKKHSGHAVALFKDGKNPSGIFKTHRIESFTKADDFDFLEGNILRNSPSGNPVQEKSA